MRAPTTSRHQEIQQQSALKSLAALVNVLLLIYQNIPCCLHCLFP